MSDQLDRKPLHSPGLWSPLAWFIRLRWVAALAVIGGALLDLTWLHWFDDRAVRVLSVGFVVLLYNSALWKALPLVGRSRSRERGRIARWFAATQMLLDLACLTALCAWTGGLKSPVATFFVFHMVFASLLLPATIAYAAAGVALAMMSAGLVITDQFPTTRADVLMLAGRAVTLIFTVFLTNRLTRDLRRQHRRLAKQNRKIRRVTDQLRHHQESLVQHEKMVAMGQMAAGVTHEITNPLASMDSLMQLVRRKPAERLKLEVIETLHEQVGRIQQTISQMKAFAHPASESQRKNTAVGGLIERAIAFVRYDPRAARVNFSTEVAPDVGAIDVLPQAMEQVLVNLILNALDAVAEVDEPKVIVRASRRDDTCSIEVTDNGCGIKSEHMHRLFEPFFTTKPVGKGTGLGLSISYSLVQKQGGAISVRSATGKGTTFTVRMPVGLRPSVPTAGKAARSPL
jgi:signal transduction histidine kinase